MGDPLDDDQGPTKRIRVDAPLSQHHSHAPECHSVKRFQPVHEQVQSIACPPHLALPLHSRAWPAGATEPRQELHPTTQHLNTRHAKAQALQRRHPCADDSDTYMLSLDHYHSAQQHMDGVCQPADVTMAPAATPTATLYASWPDSSNAVPLDTSWRWPSTSSAPSSRSSSSTSSPPMPSPSPMVLALQQPLLAGNGVDAGSVHLLSSSGVTSPSVTSPAVPATDFSFSPASPTRLAHISRRPHCHLQKRPRHSQPTTEDDSTRGHHHHQAQSKGQSARKPFRATILVSPFKDCVGNFGEAHRWHFARPVDGKVNGYIKFNWPKDRDSRRPSSIYASSISDFSNIPELYASGPEADASVSLLSIGPVPASSPTLIAVPPDFDHTQFDFSSFLYGPAASGLDVVTSAASSPAADGTMEGWNEAAPLGAPRMVPKLFGYEAQMDQTDRRFWSFYIKNWCPGRSVLFETNLWLRDFAQMHKSDGVRAAIQSLAGIYIYDYQPIDSVRKRVNERFYEAESRFSHLLNDPATSQNEAQANEFITMAVILSMQDIVLTERRLQKPHEPRWLSGFRQGELFLQATDQGSRFWKRSNAQLSSLRVSQSVIVGRAMILAQPMMKLPSPDTFDPQQETTRFGWLLYGTERDVYEIHGGCGFSKKLLHIISQITYCAARLQQDPENIVVPMTTQYLHAELLQMRQWSSESKDWEVAKTCPSVIDWAMSVSEGYIITSSAEMTDVTAEAWRLTAIIYLQCRVLRLSRRHPSVVLNLSYLARCIQIMPTSGYQFTAQAPLFPVFLLGMLATVPEHKHVSQMWFQDVVSTPVRSSVPPLYHVLQQIWTWVDSEVAMALADDAGMPESIGLRYPWWEHLVHQVDIREGEVLCLT